MAGWPLRRQGCRCSVPDDRLQLGAGGDFQLGEDMVEMSADRPGRDVKALSDLAIGQTLGGQMGDLLFLLGQFSPRFGLAASSLTLRLEVPAAPVLPMGQHQVRRTRRARCAVAFVLALSCDDGATRCRTQVAGAPGTGANGSNSPPARPESGLRRRRRRRAMGARTEARRPGGGMSSGRGPQTWSALRGLRRYARTVVRPRRTPRCTRHCGSRGGRDHEDRRCVEDARRPRHGAHHSVRLKRGPTGCRTAQHWPSAGAREPRLR